MLGFSRFYNLSFCNFLTHSIRLRFFKLIHGGLKLNNQTCHLPNPTKRDCYHCKRSKKIGYDENWNHLLLNCNFFSQLSEKSRLPPEPTVREREKYAFECFLSGSRSEYYAYNELVKLSAFLGYFYAT